MDHLLIWSKKNSLELNLKKTKEIVQTTIKSITIKNLHSSDSTIEQVSSGKLLGITISANLRWTTHIDNTIKKASQRIFLLKVLKNSGLPNQKLWMYYNEMVRSILSYGFPSFCNLPASQLNRLYNIEKRASRIIGTTPHITAFTVNLCKNQVKK